MAQRKELYSLTLPSDDGFWCSKRLVVAAGTSPHTSLAGLTSLDFIRTIVLDTKHYGAILPHIVDFRPPLLHIPP